MTRAVGARHGGALRHLRLRGVHAALGCGEDGFGGDAVGGGGCPAGHQVKLESGYVAVADACFPPDFDISGTACIVPPLTE